MQFSSILNFRYHFPYDFPYMSHIFPPETSPFSPQPGPRPRRRPRPARYPADLHGRGLGESSDAGRQKRGAAGGGARGADGVLRALWPLCRLGDDGMMG